MVMQDSASDGIACAADCAIDGRVLVGRPHPSIHALADRLSLPGFDVRVVDPDSDDVDLVHAWMNSEAVAAGWGQAWPLEQWREHLRWQVSGTYSLPFIVSDTEADFAYVELYRAHADVVALHYPSDPHDVGFHLAIGADGRRGTGAAAKVGMAFVAAVFAAEPQCRRMISDPDVRNTAAVHIDRSLGLTDLGVAELPHKTAALFAAERAMFERAGRQ